MRAHRSSTADRNEDGSPVVLDANTIVAKLRHHLRLWDIGGLGEMSEQGWDEACRECGVPVELLTAAIQSRVRVLLLQEALEDRRR